MPVIAVALDFNFKNETYAIVSNCSIQELNRKHFSLIVSRPVSDAKQAPKTTFEYPGINLSNRFEGAVAEPLFIS